MQSIIHMPHFSVEYRREEIDVRMMSPSRVQDEQWRYVDKKGHGHFWDSEKLPTLKKVKTGTTWVGDEYDGSEITIYEYRCRQCGETIEPVYKLKYGPDTIPGPAWMIVTVNNEEFQLTPEQYAQSIDAWQESLREIQGERWNSR